MYEQIFLMAIKSNHPQAVARLVNHIDLTKEIENKLTPIQLAVELGHWECAEAIAKNKKADADDSARYGDALLDAVEQNRIDTAKLLLEAGASKTLIWDDGDTALHLAIRKGYTKMLALLLSFDFDLTVKNNANKTPEQLATSLYVNHLKDAWKMYYNSEMIKIYNILAVFVQAMRQPGSTLYKLPLAVIDAILIPYLGKYIVKGVDTLTRTKEGITKISARCFINEYNSYFHLHSDKARNFTRDLEKILEKSSDVTNAIHKAAHTYIKNKEETYWGKARSIDLLYKYKLVNRQQKNSDVEDKKAFHTEFTKL